MVDCIVALKPDRCRAVLVALALAVASLLLTSSPALAVLSHSTIEKEFSGGPGCGNVVDLGVLESSSTVYVLCDGENSNPSIRKLDFNGNPVAFSGSGTYVSGNEITGSPTSQIGFLGERMAVDNSSVHNGYIYVVSAKGTSYASTNIDIYNPAGEWIDAIPAAGTFPATMMDVDVGPEGDLYMINGDGGYVDYIAKYDNAFHEIERLYTGRDGVYLRVNSDGTLWADFGSKLSLYEPDGFSKNLGVGFESPQAQKESVVVAPSARFPDPFLEASDLKNFDLDPNNDDLYVDRGNRIEIYGPPIGEEPPLRIAPPFGTTTLKESSVVAVTKDHHVFASKRGGEIVKFGPGDILPDITSPPPSIDDVGHTSALVHAHVDLAGGTNIKSCKVQYGKDATYSGPGSGTVPCTPDPSAGEFTQATDVVAEITGLTTGTSYHYRFSAGNAKGENSGADRTVVPAYVLKTQTLPASDIEDHKVTLHGSLDPDGLDTQYRFQYGVDKDYGSQTPSVDAGAGNGAVLIDEDLAGLPAGKLFHVRLVASNANGTTYGQDLTFVTGGVPGVRGVRAVEVAATSAVLEATVDPLGYDTEYHFEYGTTPEYGQSIPVPSAQLAGGGGPVSVSQRIEGLQSGVTYYFRVVATNRWGTSASPTTTFDYSPPECPNNHVRQQTDSSFLPDCRAYELVSPEYAGAVALVPSQGAWDKTPGTRWALNTGRATTPARFTFFGSGGVINGIDAPNASLDMYMTTRTNSGWVTTLPGLTGSRAGETVRKECSETMDVCIDHNGESAPYVFNSEGKELGQLPDSVKAIPGAAYFTGAQRLSGDGNHFLFSSSDIAFTPGGVSGGLGSAYDDVRNSRSISLVSKLPDGTNMTAETGADTHPIEFPAVSPDASHVLMQTPAKNKLVHLYMRVNHAITYAIAGGASVSFIGATRDGSKVYIVSAERLTTADTDSSKDIYVWSEAGELEGKPLTLVSQGNGTECSPTWSNGCEAVPLSTERGNPDGQASVPGLDDKLAEDSGDLYFYSPEILDPGTPGIPGQRNLYVYRHGVVHLVAVLDPKTQINRIQISPDGLHSAFVTASHLTSYNNKTYKEMYTYDAETGLIRCASCNPSGLPPTSDVEASQGGRFMSDDGRAFFASKDSLDPHDTNGTITDVYEYVGGRPQLISSGFGARDFTGGSPLVAVLQITEYTGLEGVSRFGTDVFFSTYDTLVTGDRNGSTVKFYDARTGGGFPTQPDLAQCAAADECHGADTVSPASPTIATGAGLGVGGNVTETKATGIKKSKAKKHGKAKKNGKKSKHGKKGRHQAPHAPARHSNG